MGHSVPHSSDNTIIHPRSLAERLKTVEGEAEPLGLEQASEVSITAPDLGLRVSNTLLAVLILVSLVPSATIGALLWQGVITTPLSTNAVEGNDNSPRETEKMLPQSFPRKRFSRSRMSRIFQLPSVRPPRSRRRGTKRSPL